MSGIRGKAQFGPDLTDVEIENMGHGQYLHEHSDEYANKLIEYLQG